MAMRFQLRTELPVVVELTVENEMYGVILIVNGLLATFYVDDAQASHCQTDPSGDESAIIIWSTMGDHIGHLLERVGVDRPAWITERYAANATHRVFSLLFRSDVEVTRP
jgi:hypothetical protein